MKEGYFGEARNYRNEIWCIEAKSQNDSKPRRSPTVIAFCHWHHFQDIEGFKRLVLEKEQRKWDWNRTDSLRFFYFHKSIDHWERWSIYLHLGSVVSTNNSSELDITQHISNSRSTFAVLSKVGKCRYPSTNIKFKLFCTNVLSILVIENSA